MAGEIATQPVQPSFHAERPTAQGLVGGLKEKIRDNPLRPEHRARRSAERAKSRISTHTLAQMRETRKQGAEPRALNLHEDVKFKRLMEGERANIIKSKQEMGNMTGLTPREQAEADQKAYKRFVSDDTNAADYYRRLGLYVGTADKNGNCRVDYRADPFMRSIDAQVQALNRSQDPNQIAQADAILDTFARDARQKAEVYAAAGHKGLKKALERVDASPMPTRTTPESQTKTPQTPDVQVTTESDTAEQVRRIQELSTKQGGLTFREQNELKALRKNNVSAIAEARGLRQRLEDPNGEPLHDKELAQLEAYAPLLNMPEASTSIAPPAPTETEADRRVRETKEKTDRKILGLNAYAELTTKLKLDLSTETEQGMLDKLAKGSIKNPDGSVWRDDVITQTYIKAAFAEKAILDATEASIPQTTRDTLKQNGLNILELLLAMATAAAIAEGKKAIAST